MESSVSLSNNEKNIWNWKLDALAMLCFAILQLRELGSSSSWKTSTCSIWVLSAWNIAKPSNFVMALMAAHFSDLMLQRIATFYCKFPPGNLFSLVCQGSWMHTYINTKLLDHRSSVRATHLAAMQCSPMRPIKWDPRKSGGHFSKDMCFHKTAANRWQP